MGVASFNQLLASSYLYFTAAFRYGDELSSFTALIRTITEAFSTELELHEVVLVCGMASNGVEDCNVHYACYIMLPSIPSMHAPISVPPPHHQVQDFFAENPDAAVLQAIEVIQGNIQWVNSNQNSLGTWLNWWNTP